MHVSEASGQMRWRGHQQSELTSTEFPVDGDIEMDNFDTPAGPAGGHQGNSSITADIQLSFPEYPVPHLSSRITTKRSTLALLKCTERGPH